MPMIIVSRSRCMRCVSGVCSLVATIDHSSSVRFVTDCWVTDPHHSTPRCLSTTTSSAARGTVIVLMMITGYNLLANKYRFLGDRFVENGLIELGHQGEMRRRDDVRRERGEKKWEMAFLSVLFCLNLEGSL